MQRPKIIGISGGSGSGKTTLAAALYRAIGAGNAVLISEDDYYKNTASLPGFGDPDFNYDDPIIRDHELLLEHLGKFSLGKEFQKPIYDFANHCRKLETETIFPCQFWILEGTHALVNVQIREKFDFKVYVETAEELRFARRLARDITERGRTEESVIFQYNKNVMPSHLKWTEPTREFADLIVENNSDGIDEANLQLNQAIAKIINALKD